MGAASYHTLAAGVEITGEFEDRRSRYTRAALVLAGYSPAQVREFQSDWHLAADGIAGPTTRATLHAELTNQPLVTFGA